MASLDIDDVSVTGTWVRHLPAGGEPGYRDRLVPFLDTERHGVLATRSPRRPNPIGLSLVELAAVEPGVLHVLGVDLLDGTPVLDVKPYVPLFDARSPVREGWFGPVAERVHEVRSDRRYEPRTE